MVFQQPARPPAEVVVTGVGLITPLGDDPDTLWSNLLSGASGVRWWDDLEAEGFRTPVAGRAIAFPGEDATRGRRMAVAAARAALANAAAVLTGTTGVFVGTTMGESGAFERAASGEAVSLAQATARGLPLAIREALGVSGPARAYAAACAAGNYAIGAAAKAVASGRVALALAGGVDPFSRIALTGFSRSRAMAADRCRPFDLHRTGMVLSEAAAFLVVERAEDALARGRRPLARICALGLSCDAYHPTAPRPEGAGMAEAMIAGIAEAGIEAADIDWVCAHGSGTVASDAAEARALHLVFGDSPPPVTGVKGALGHSMGAASAVEAVITAMALDRKVLPPTTNLVQPDPACALDVFASPRAASGIRWAINSAYGFGGLNSALLMEAI